MTETDIRQRKYLRGEARLQLAKELKRRYNAGASVKELAEETGRSAYNVRDLLALARTRMRPGGSPRKAKKPEPRVIVKRVVFREPSDPAVPTGPLNKTRLAELVAADLGIDLKDAYRVLNTIFGTVARTVTAGHDVTVTNFGTWRAVEHPARMARNPHTGEPVQVPSRAAVHFRVAPRLQDVVRAGDPTASLKKRPSH